MKPLSVSFIMPYYKVEIALLARAVESVRALEDAIDWEIWIIDDGTPGDEAGTYVGRLNDRRVHYHPQSNQGPGGARNTGMELAQKEYIHFLDADDYLFRSPMLKALDLLSARRPDILAFRSEKVYARAVSDAPTHCQEQVVFQGSGVDFMLRHNLHGSMGSYMFRRDIAGGLRFTPLAYHEDEEFTALLFLKARKLMVTTLPVYAYYQRKGSIMHRSDTKFVRKRFLDLITIIQNLKAQRTGMAPPASVALEKRIDMLQMSMVYTLLGDSPDTGFLLDMLRRMKEKGMFPLAKRSGSLPYTLVRISTLNPHAAMAVSKIFRLFHYRHAGKSS